MTDATLTIIGNMVSAPELRFTPSGAAVAGFTIASTPRRYNRDTQQYEDGEPLFMRCSLWRQPAENATESLTKGMRVIAQGRLKQRSFETREGEKRTVVELDVDEIGPSLKFATATVQKSSGGSQQYAPNSGSWGGQDGNAEAPF